MALYTIVHVCTDRLAFLDLFAYTRNFKRFRQEIRDICIEQTDSEQVHDIFGVLTIPHYIQNCVRCIVWARGKQFRARHVINTDSFMYVCLFAGFCNSYIITKSNGLDYPHMCSINHALTMVSLN